MRVETRPLDAIRPYADNPRTIPEEAVEAVAESIRRYGFRQPIVVDAEGVIIAGHTRWLAAQHLGLDEAPVHVASDLTPDQTRALRLVDNRVAELTTWNAPQLLSEVRSLDAADVSGLEAVGLGAGWLRPLAATFDPLGPEGERPPARPGAAYSVLRQFARCKEALIFGNRKLDLPPDIVAWLGDDPLETLRRAMDRDRREQ